MAIRSRLLDGNVDEVPQGVPRPANEAGRNRSGVKHGCSLLVVPRRALDAPELWIQGEAEA
jgi:hypothetical protein